MDTEILTLKPYRAEQSRKTKRPGFVATTPEIGDIEKDHQNWILPDKLIYHASKLTHNGIVGYRVFENYYRSFNSKSIGNLLSSTLHGSETLDWLVQQYKACITDDERKRINDQAQSMCDQESFDKYLTFTRQERRLNKSQSRKVKAMADKLAYYSATRRFASKRSGKYDFKVAFLTLTAPEGATTDQILKAFDIMLDYLARTGNCRYVWKKELGEQSHNLHFHVIINNFIPYYIINWKWKRALLSQGVSWPLNSEGKDTASHYRIEMPKSKKAVAHYIAKYISKAYCMPAEYGYIAGWSRVLNSLAETTIFEGDVLDREVSTVLNKARVKVTDWVTLAFCDILSLKDIAPGIHAVFEEQYKRFCEILTLPQRFFVV